MGRAPLHARDLDGGARDASGGAAHQDVHAGGEAGAQHKRVLEGEHG